MSKFDYNIHQKKRYEFFKGKKNHKIQRIYIEFFSSNKNIINKFGKSPNIKYGKLIK